MLLRGCNNVMLLRQRSHVYYHQGTVDVHGILDGEMNDLFDDRAFREEETCLV